MKKTFLFVTTEECWNKKSHYFFSDYISEFFKLDYLIILKSYEKEFLNTPLNSNKYAGIIFWGEIFDTKLIKKVINKNITFIPMMNYIHPKKLAWWYRIRGIKILCLTNFLHKQLQKHQFNTIHLKYYENPQEKIKYFNANEVQKRPLKVFINPIPNRKTAGIALKVLKNCHYTFADKLNENTDIYLSLEKYNGLEKEMMTALSMGKIIIGNNTPTMNEYIKHNTNGFLYRYNLPLSVDFSKIVDIQKNLIENVKIGAVKWQVHRKKIPAFLLK